MLIDSQSEGLFAEPAKSSRLKILGAVLAVAVAAVVLVGYTYLRNKHARDTAAKLAAATVVPEPKGPPQAVLSIDEALINKGNILLGGTVKNIGERRLGPLTVELELKRRKDAGIEKRTLNLAPTELEPQQEGRYSLEFKSQEFGSARVIALMDGGSQALAYSTTPGRKRPLERTESKTIVVGKPSSNKNDGFLNTADNPARIP